MAKLAIKGHPTRSKEVIEILEMLGGINTGHLKGERIELAYYIEIDKSICCLDIEFKYLTKFYKFTLEQFLEKFHYKVGDKVYYDNKVCDVIEMLWNSNLNTISYGVYDGKIKNLAIVEELKPYKEETMEGKLISKEEVSLKIDTSQMEKRQIIFSADAPNETELVLGDNFEIKVEDGKTFVVKKKPQYPKTYEGCCKITRSDPDFYIDTDLYGDKLGALYKLLICRDAYWKLAGNWKPDWIQATYTCTIICRSNNIVNDDGFEAENKILAFPTSEIRDAFYENFKELIEECKELL